MPILLVDDESQFLAGVARLLQAAGFSRIITLDDASQVAPTLGAQEVGAVVLEPAMPSSDGRSLLHEVVRRFPEVPVVVLSVINDLHVAVEYMRAGAVDYLVKPVEQSRLASAVRRAIGRRDGPAVSEEEAAALARTVGDDAIVTHNGSMLALFRRIAAVAPSPRSVLITGESGTGKELVAQAVHRLSRRPGELITVNVAGLDDALFADTLFGHTRGAFTSAERSRDGLIEAAADGTIFLDEIGDLSAATQVKLLRLLQDGAYYPLGSDGPRQSRARVVAATNCDIAAAVAEGRFRRDLYHRLRTHHLEVPPLRARLDDVPLLVRHFADSAALALGKPCPWLPPELHALLGTYAFPGNVRELEAMVFDAVALSDGRTLSLRSVKEAIFSSGALTRGHPRGGAIEITGSLPTLREAETDLISRALGRANGNQSIAAGLLGLSRQALNKRLTRRRAIRGR